MTRFWRKGFWRTSALGEKHWVEGHWVERDDWERSSGHRYAPYAAHEYRSTPNLSTFGIPSSLTSRFVNPNAKCPVCGAVVFFYQNEFGSRVYFDELGPPWPKHPCTDGSRYKLISINGGLDSEAVYPALKNRESSSSISKLSDYYHSEDWISENEFCDKYGVNPWGCGEVLRRVKGVGKTLLILMAVGENKYMYIAAKRLPRIIEQGSIVFYKRLRLAYFDTTSMKPYECEVERLSAKEFIETQFGLR